MDVDVDSAKTNSNSEDSKSEKEKGKRKLYVGSQALNYRRDHMEVISFSPLLIIIESVKYNQHFSIIRSCHQSKMVQFLIGTWWIIYGTMLSGNGVKLQFFSWLLFDVISNVFFMSEGVV